MISQTAEYALRVIVFLAARDGKSVLTRDIATETCIPKGYLAKVLQQLVRAGIVGSQRGLHGGFVLVSDPAQLSVYDVLRVVDPVRRITACPLGLPSHSTQLCPLHRRLDDAAKLVEDAFRDTPIAQLLRKDAPSTPLCETPSLDGRDGPRPAPIAVPVPVPLTLSRHRRAARRTTG